MKYYFPIHLDGGNRGCEAIAKSSALLIGEQPANMVGYCRNTDLDTRLGVDQYLTLLPRQRGSYIVDRFLAALNKFLHTSTTKKWRELYPYRALLRLVRQDDIVPFTGGDMMCYDDNELIYINNWLHERSVKTVLWGCSMGPENETAAKLKTLRNFSLIYARESLSYDYFKSLGLKNLCLLPDPAFILPAEECALPDYFEGNNLVGLNISNYVMGGVTIDSRFGQEVLHLIRHILGDTNLQIVLIPHVTWNDGYVNQDDRQMARIICEHLGCPERVHILDIDRMNYCQIRYAISRCRLFIGARTHAVISAYSTCVPTIALGYSIKSRGIAKDLGLSESLVVNSKNFTDGALQRSFEYLVEHEETIRQHLLDVMPEYKQRSYHIKDYIVSLKEDNSK